MTVTEEKKELLSSLFPDIDTLFWLYNFAY